MKRKATLAFFLALAATPLLSAMDIDLASYLKLVEEHNRDLQIARGDVAQTEEQRKQALAALLPNAGVQAGYSRSVMGVYLPDSPSAMSSFLPGVTQITNHTNQWDFGAGLNVTIFDGTAWARYGQASEGVAARRVGYDYERKAILNAAKKLYYQVLLLDEVVKVKESSEKIAQDNYNDVHVKFNAGLTTELDSLLAEVAWKGKAPETAEARSNRDIALLAFKQLAGIPSNSDVALTEGMETYPQAPGEARLSDVLSARSDYALLLHQRTLAELAIKEAQANYLPSLTGSVSVAGVRINGDMAYNDSSSVPLQLGLDTLQLGLKITLPVFEGGYRSAKLSEEEIGLAKCNTEIAKKQEDIGRELMSARLRLDETSGRIQNASLVLTVAQRAYDKATVSFKNGVATQLQLNQASLNLEGAHLAYLSAVYDYLASYFDWEMAAGK